MKRFLAGAALVAAAAPAFADAPGTLDVSTSDSRGTISVDGAQVGVGAFHGDIAPGTHEITVVRPGFQTYRNSVVVETGKTLSLSVSLEREAALVAPPAPEAFGGFYGGFFIGPSFEPAGMGSTFEQSCPLIGAVSCSASGPAGIVVAGHFGYTWDPVGIEVFAAFGTDYTSPSATFNGVVMPGSNVALTGPARNEQFRVLRMGGMAALRARGTVDGQRLRFSFAAGAGFGEHAMAMDRTATTTDGTNMTDTFAPPVISYFSPALSFEATFAWRLSRVVSVTAGLAAWIESVNNASTLGDPQHYFLPAGVPLRTPSYRLAGGPQFFLWPFVGMAFGP